MNDLAPKDRQRKVLSLKKETVEQASADVPDAPTRFTKREDCVFMVYSETGYMPQRVYRPEELKKALHHARTLAAENGGRYHVMRSWRSFEGVDE